jgi:hypothetical protein
MSSVSYMPFNAPNNDTAKYTAFGKVGEVFRAFLKLGLTSFGGTIAHLGYFRDELALRRKWIDEAELRRHARISQIRYWRARHRNFRLCRASPPSFELLAEFSVLLDPLLHPIQTEADAEHIGQFREMLLDFVARSRAPGTRDVGLAYWVHGT